VTGSPVLFAGRSSNGRFFAQTPQSVAMCNEWSQNSSVAELIALVVGASQAAEHAGRDSAVRARILQVVFDGLRPVDRSLM
jgi:hypothetical protein